MDKKIREDFRVEVLHLDKKLYDDFNIDSIERVIDKLDEYKAACDTCKNHDKDLEKLCTMVTKMPDMTKEETKTFNDEFLKIKKHLVVKHKQAYEGQYTLTFFAIGIGFGVAFGNAYNGLGIGIGLGVAFGLAIGNALDKKAKQDNRVV